MVKLPPGFELRPSPTNVDQDPRRYRIAVPEARYCEKCDRRISANMVLCLKCRIADQEQAGKVDPALLRVAQKVKLAPYEQHMKDWIDSASKPGAPLTEEEKQILDSLRV